MSCPTCLDTGLVAPDAFGHPEPWDSYCASVASLCRALALPEHVSPLLTPQPCPDCSSQSPAGAGSSMGVTPGAGAIANASVPGHEDDAFVLGWP